MSTTRSNVAGRISEALNQPSVADAAGVPPATWASPDSPHVFRGFGVYLGGRNRGRLPFIEYDIQAQPFTQETYEGGTVQTTVRITAHAGGRDLDVVNTLLDSILMSVLSCLRSPDEDNYLSIGSESVGAIEQSPWGHQMSVELTVSHSYSRETYERE
jgi:hypothetical protein